MTGAFLVLWFDCGVSDLRFLVFKVCLWRKRQVRSWFYDLIVVQVTSAFLVYGLIVVQVTSAFFLWFDCGASHKSFLGFVWFDFCASHKRVLVFMV